jgi:hypothetical protein
MLNILCNSIKINDHLRTNRNILCQKISLLLNYERTLFSCFLQKNQFIIAVNTKLQVSHIFNTYLTFSFFKSKKCQTYDRVS